MESLSGRRGVSSAAIAIAVVALVVVAAASYVYIARRPGAAASTTTTSSFTSTTTETASSTLASSTYTRTEGLGSPPGPGASLLNITYCHAGGVALQLDLYYPPANYSAPFPLVLYVHGGGWRLGDKSAVKGSPVWGMQDKGFVIGSVDYRLSPNYTFPSQIEDVKCSVRYLRANAQFYELNPNEFGAYGPSAGGHLVSLLAVAGRSAGWDVGQYANYSSSVQAVVDVSGPENLTATDFGKAGIEAIAEDFGANASVLQDGSPINHVAAGDPPFLLQYGYNDTLIPYNQGIQFYDALKVAGDNATLVLVNNAGHELKPINSLPEDPSQSVTDAQVVNFFVDQLG